MIKKLLFSFALCILLCSAGASAEVDIVGEQSRALGTYELPRALPDDASKIMRNFSPRDIDLDEGIGTLLKEGSGKALGIFRQALSNAALLLAIGALSGSLTAMHDGISNNSRYAVLAGTLGVAAVCTGRLDSLLNMGSETINSINVFSKGLMATLAAASAASGSPFASAARQMATVLFSDAMISVMSELLLPLVYAYMALCFANAAAGNNLLERTAGFIKWLITGLMGITLMIFVTYLSLSGAIAGNADRLAAKTARFAISGAVPVVGGIISDAAESVVAGASVIKNTVGVFGVIAILGICLVPFLQLAIHYITYKAAAAVISPVADGRVVRLMDDIGGAFGIILGMVGSCALLMLISIISAITASGGAG